MILPPHSRALRGGGHAADDPVAPTDGDVPDHPTCARSVSPGGACSWTTTFRKVQHADNL